MRVGEMVQKNMQAGLYRTGWLSPRHEHALGEFHRKIHAAVDPQIPA